MKKVFILFMLISLGAELSAQNKATWIWYPGDFEVWLSNKMQNRRTERGSFFPPFWRMDNHYVLIDFHKVFDVPSEEQVELYVEGQFNVKIDGKGISGYPRTITMPAGKHKLSLKVFCQDRVPAIFVKGKTVVSDSSWLVTYEDKEWIDASGKASDQSGTNWLSAGSWNFDSPSVPPSKFALATAPQSPVKVEKVAGSLLVDFGKETFGFIRLKGLKGNGRVSVYYGESKEEALATETCETLDHLEINAPVKKDSVMNLTKAFRFVNVKYDPDVSIDSVSMLYEYLPVADRGDFRCSDAEINRIYDVSKYTFHLNTREFFIDGIKRDRWIWSGDAYQSYLMNYYLLFDSPSVTRTLLALRGKDPVSSHINTIMDYTFYWFLGISDYYLYTGDKKFIEQFYPRMQSLMEFCLSRRNGDGLMEGLPGDWVFIDWADGLSKQGAVSFEQLLLARSLETMATCSKIVNDPEGAAKYEKLASSLKAKIFATYWSEQKQALVHSLVAGKQTENVTRYANMFGIFFDYFNEQQKQGVKQRVLLNDKIQKITTPYMRFYELEALCAMGEQKHVLREMKDYWGGMLKLGATSFWEEYNPSKKGAEHYAMYGRPFGKSLCHAWGASPLYLLGKYYLGVKPLSPGYASYVVEPVLGGLKWMDGKVPTPAGDVKVYCSTKEIRVQGVAGAGVLRIKSKTKPSGDGLEVKPLGNQLYEIGIGQNKAITVRYSAL
ncbi:alpha-L-rhamnosidase C-terminal domain-containing protein [Arcticibacter tournemirensis]|uniref:Alpha-rhamnosidase n=1 Tax=Arcticibacter tournemirensis TaxID=699437 RepID=A0A4Q0MDZ6_9SPHI|nr:family 78 glycoside hydrolase catalytic domain [Arcticibacter tournemirensis]RXF71036.1 alpha-rhamnosidase [Arcticibacter tournemirensis]